MDRDLRAAKRLVGCRQALAEVGLEPVAVRTYAVRSHHALGGQALLEVLRDHPNVDAVFFSNDDLAVGAVLEGVRQGIPIPDRVAIAGFNGLEIGQSISPRLTTVKAPRSRIGQLAAQKILNRILGDGDTEPVTDVGFEVLVGGTTSVSGAIRA
jgi:LacI family gluconate utilization system Gnt-I transcriptional repressor